MGITAIMDTVYFMTFALAIAVVKILGSMLPVRMPSIFVVVFR